MASPSVAAAPVLADGEAAAIATGPEKGAGEERGERTWRVFAGRS
jgi:hypothetical protein